MLLPRLGVVQRAPQVLVGPRDLATQQGALAEVAVQRRLLGRGHEGGGLLQQAHGLWPGALLHGLVRALVQALDGLGRGQ